jgi:hypothetical protein
VRSPDQADVGLPKEKHPKADGKYGRGHRGQWQLLLRTRQPMESNMRLVLVAPAVFVTS